MYIEYSRNIYMNNSLRITTLFCWFSLKLMSGNNIQMYTKIATNILKFSYILYNFVNLINIQKDD